MGGKQLRLPAKGRKDVPTIQDHKDIIDREHWGEKWWLEMQ